MRRAALVLVLAAAGLLAAWSLVTTAQVIDPSPCEQACQEQKTVCVSACGAHADPVECEAKCHEALQDCLEGCR